jgi:hypothetical protein
MPQYYVNKNAQENGDHEVHEETCAYLPAPANRVALGWHPSCHGAVAEARSSMPRRTAAPNAAPLPPLLTPHRGPMDRGRQAGQPPALPHPPLG